MLHFLRMPLSATSKALVRGDGLETLPQWRHLWESISWTLSTHIEYILNITILCCHGYLALASTTGCLESVISNDLNETGKGL